jgi:hypothetical protein
MAPQQAEEGVERKKRTRGTGWKRRANGSGAAQAERW